MAEGAVAFLLETLTGLLNYYGHLTGGAENELRDLRRELELLKSCLKEAASLRPEKGPHFKEIEKQTREIIHEVEDDLDTYLTEADAAAAAAAPKKSWKHFVKKMLSAPKTLGMAEKVKSHRQTVRLIYEKAINELDNIKNREGCRPLGEELRTIVKKEIVTIRQDKVVGFEDEEKKITGYLTEEKTELDVICIIGMPGLGKTTLAWKIYQSHNTTTPALFDILVWFNVSQNFNKKDLFLNILKKINTEDVSGWSDQELHDTVRKCLEKEKFLIVLDDVWSVDDWISIRNVLPLSNGMGKVVITSRDREVGARAGVREPHMLKLLTKEASWELLQLEVFKNVDRCPVELKDMGKRIAENCGGLPLTIGVVGGILLGQTTRDHRPIGMIKNDWNKVSENLARLLKIDKDKRISDVVGLSYDVLPDELRDCFVYMGVFPEDYEIPAWTLTRLWIAEGFIQKKDDGQSLVETAYEHLNDLINRNLLMVGATNPIGEVKTCRVHGVIRAFCTSKAADQNLFQEIILSNEGAFEIQKDHRRLCFHSNLPLFLSRKPTGPRVRSLLCFNKEAVVLEDKLTSAIPDAFNLLRVLDSVSVQFQIYPTKLTNLIHLRYITLYVHYLTILPESISRLWSLQTLVVDTNSHILTMKADIWRMFCLRHLKTKAAIVLDQNSRGKAAGGGSQNLQTLTTLSQESCTERVSRRARNIKKLAIRVKSDTSFPDTKFLTNLTMLEKLKLVMDYSTASRKPYRLPLPNYFPSNLKKLTLMRTFLDWSRMSTTLAKIKTLEVLKLKDNAFTGLIWQAVGIGFPSLQRLLIADVDLVIWETTTDYFPSLTCLSLSNCEKLKEIPHQVATCLRKLDVDGLRSSAVESAEKIRERKIQEQGQQSDRWGGGFQLSVGSICV